MEGENTSWGIVGSFFLLFIGGSEGKKGKWDKGALFLFTVLKKNVISSSRREKGSRNSFPLFLSKIKKQPSEDFIDFIDNRSIQCGLL